MDIDHPATHDVFASVTPDGDGDTIAEIAAAPKHVGFTMKEVAAGQSQSPFVIMSLLNGTRRPGENIVIPDGAVFKALSTWRLWVESSL